MDEQFKKEERILKKLITGAGLEQPTPYFKSRVMELVEQKVDTPTTYKPLITKKGWLLVAVCFVGIFVVLYLYPSGILNGNGTVLSFEKMSGLIPEMTFSRNLVYGIIFLSLFIFQVPFLKRYMERSYH